MTISSVAKDGGYLVIIEDGITKRRSIVYEDAVCSLPPTGYTEVGVIYVDEINNTLIIKYNGTTTELELDGVTHDEIRLTPKASSSGPEGTMFYASDDDHVYVGTM